MVAAVLASSLLPVSPVATRAADAPGADAIYLERTLPFTGGRYHEHAFPYRLMTPAGFYTGARDAGAKWPLVLFLHGAGERGDDNRLQLKYFPTDMASAESRARYPVFVLAPQCPKDRAWSAPSLRDLSQPFQPEPVEEARAVMAILDRVLEEFPIDRRRVYLTGLSMGGFGSWDLAARYPERWAAVAPICGGGDPATAPRFKDLPLWAFHGGKDTVVPPERTRDMVEALRAAGGEPRSTEFPDAGHDSWTPAYHLPEFLPWLLREERPASEAARAWFRDAKFGLFIHWGVYSLIGRGEWAMQNEKIPVAEYEKLPPRFNPTGFDAAEWVGIARRAGQRYITITSKHHDGFCMWDSKRTQYDIVDATPYGRDVLRLLSDECRRQGIKLFFYHSHLDWHHPDYYPRGRTGHSTGRPESGDWNRYIEYLSAQIAELASPPYEAAGFWFDGWWDRPDAEWELARTYGLIHRLRPEALIGNNHHVAPFPGEDFQMFEQDLPGRNTAGFNAAATSALPLETCRTMNNSWGYNAGDHAYRPVEQQIRYLVEAVGLGANLLLNVGPMPDGRFPPEAVEVLLGIGRWLDRHGESVYGTRPGPWTPSRSGYAVRRDRRVYFHVLAWPAGGRLVLPAIPGLVRAALFDGGVLRPERSGETIVLPLPESARDPVDTVVVLDFDRDLAGTIVEVPSESTR